MANSSCSAQSHLREPNTSDVRHISWMRTGTPSTFATAEAAVADNDDDDDAFADSVESVTVLKVIV